MNSKQQSIIKKSVPSFCTGDAIAKYYGNVKFAWKPQIPVGHVTMIAGPQGCGKSYWLAYLIGCLTGKLSWPDGTPTTGKGEVLIVETEEMRGAYVERMDMMGIPRNAYIFGPGGAVFIPDLLRNADQIERLAQHRNSVAIVIDSLSGGHSLKENSAQMRKLLRRYSKMAAVLQVPIIMVHHANKRSQLESIRMTLDRVRGSSTITQFCRSVIGLGRMDEFDQSAPVRVETLKVTFGAPPRPLGFVIRDDGLTLCEPPQISEETTATDAARSLLKVILIGGPKKVSDIKAEVESAGMSWRKMERARTAMGVTTERVDPPPGEPAYWVWALPTLIQ